MSVFSRTGQSDDEILNFLNGTPWIMAPGFHYDDIQGFKEGVFGYKSATDRHISHLYHEVAHALEFYFNDPDRLSGDGFLFDLPEEFVFNQWVCEPITTQATEREIRTLAIQAAIECSNPLIDFDPESFSTQWADTLRFMPDELNIQILHLNLPDDTAYEDRLAARKQWRKDRILKAIQATDIQQIMDAWPHVLDTIQLRVAA